MFVYHCDKCKAFESFVEADEDWKCKECGNDLMPLGVTIDEWNALSEINMMKTIDFAREEAERKKRKFDVPEPMEDPNKNRPSVRINLMQCPKCFKQISPNSSSCPYCQYYFVNNPAAVKIRQSNKKAGISLIGSAVALLLIFVLYSVFVSGKFIVTLIKEALAGGYKPLDYVKGFGIYALIIVAIVFVVIGIKKLLKSRTPQSEEIFVEDIEFVSEVIYGSDLEDHESKEIMVSENVINRHENGTSAGNYSEEDESRAEESESADNSGSVEEKNESANAGEDGIEESEGTDEISED